MRVKSKLKNLFGGTSPKYNCLRKKSQLLTDKFYYEENNPKNSHSQDLIGEKLLEEISHKAKKVLIVITNDYL